MNDDLRDLLDLLDYRRRVADLYRPVREPGADRSTWQTWRDTRDALFRTHPQSPYGRDARARLGGLVYFDHDPAWRVEASIESAPTQAFDLAHSSTGTTRAERVGLARFRLFDQDLELSLYWLDQYGGGLFVPFRDATCTDTTYGGGRYLLDTAKSADLGAAGDRLIFDFNYAYHPSCFHDPQWSCPLAPPENRLPVAVEAGERSR